MSFKNYKSLDRFAYSCYTCGGDACVCSPDDNKWNAHCMDCDESIYYFNNSYAYSEIEAIKLWNSLMEGNHEKRCNWKQNERKLRTT